MERGESYARYFKGYIEGNQEIPAQQSAGLKAEKVNDIASFFEKIDDLENKEFILLLLDFLKKKNAITDDIIHFLTDINFCKNTFELQFELLRELKDGLAHKEIERMYYESGHARYYKKDIFEYKNRRYIVCNHWYGIQRKKFLKWVNDRFGKDVNIINKDNDFFTISIEAAINEGLKRWLLNWGSDAEVISPSSLRDIMRQEIKKMLTIY